MALTINGTAWEDGSPLTVGGVQVSSVTVDKAGAGPVEVWSNIPPYAGPPSPVTITATATLIAGTDFPSGVELAVCMCGGGGSGRAGDGDQCGGGGAGAVAQGSFTIPLGESVVCTIGGGGGQVPTNAFGNAGGSSSFGAYLTAGGGAGGTTTTYFGNGAGTVSPCDGATYTDGLEEAMGTWGGQASAFGNGGAGTGDGVNGGSGGIGAGGGGTYQNWSGPGGAGQITISW